MIEKTINFLLPLWAILFVSICADFTTDIGSKRYLIETDKTVNWYQANNLCTQRGMTLMSIESEVEYTNLKKYLSDQEQPLEGYWLSGSNSANTTSNVYTWLSSGKTLSYSNWISGKPDAGTSAFCIVTDGQFKWTTKECTNEDNKRYICSRLLIPNCGINGRCKNTRYFYF